MAPSTAELDAVIAEIDKIDEDAFHVMEREDYGWQHDIAAALIDAVFSIRATYHSESPDRGVLNRLRTFRSMHPEVSDDLRALVALGAHGIAETMGDSKTAGRRKGECVIEAAQVLLSLDPPVATADDLRRADKDVIRSAYTSVRGLGDVTAEYFQMLLGQPGVKPDIMIRRFANAALAASGLSPVSCGRAHDLAAEAHARDDHGVDLSRFDHAIWLQKGKLRVSEVEGA